MKLSILLAQEGTPASPEDILTLSYLGVLVVIIAVFLVVFIAQGYIKDFKQRRSRLERQVSAVFTDKDSCNHCGNSLDSTQEPAAQCGQCGQNPYQIPAIIKSRRLVNMLQGKERCPRCNADVSDTDGDSCPNCEVKSNTPVDRFNDVICANPRCNHNLRADQVVRDGPVNHCPSCGTPNPYTPSGNHPQTPA